MDDVGQEAAEDADLNFASLNYLKRNGNSICYPVGWLWSS